MFSKVLSAAVLGIDAYIVEVETHFEGGLPKFIVVGLPEGAVKESMERVNAAIKNCGLRFPNKRITVNLSPAYIRKEGSAFDLPIAMGILASVGEVSPDLLQYFLILGELSLDGTLRPIRGALPISLAARKAKKKGIIVPQANASEAAISRGVTVYPVTHLLEAVDFLNGREAIEPLRSILKKFSPRAEITLSIFRMSEARSMLSAPWK